ncbi:delta-like protein A isoform X2 [Montipora capricornis]|uniref:delta-like protein A isoform X2 n=1 Tax=Montipora capricornis TaxID=246305 RepID=UPI0035F1D844
MAIKKPPVVHVLWTFLLLGVVEVSLANQGCPAGFTGIDCSTNIDDCLNVTCSGSGNCSDRLNGYYCYCNDGFYGTNCEIDAGPCSPNPCDNNGTCIQDGDTIYCNCTADFEGDNCASGSVGAIFDITFAATSEVNETDIIQVLTRANGSSQLRFEFIGTINVMDSLSTTVVEDAPMTASPTGLESSLIIALVVSIVILVVLLAILIILTLKIRRSKKRNIGKGAVALGGIWDVQTDVRRMRLTGYSNGYS